ncbi:ELMO CED-12 domain containing 3 [Nesidiocoris tenuis]|uniref:ELMO CED-12 domain containing 3 n=1 Tax=Nesidiocoris tenuis TaxID=355587 RepID=A0ABN7AXT8_9HEMI|nr:ELMO CED-12 domain containing 3 [Nesidiocoris tenuis]
MEPLLSSNATMGSEMEPLIDHGSNCDPRIQTRDEAELEWSKVPNIVGQLKENVIIVNSPFVNVEEAILHFRKFDSPKEIDKPPPEKTKFCEVFKWFKFPVLGEELSKEFNFISSLTKCGLNWSDNVQFRILQTIYKKLTGARLDCPQRGTHWQLIGFQGNDPATDLRSVGLFGLLQFLYLTSEKMMPLAQKLYKVANSENQPFPLAVLSLNLTNIVLNVFNSGRLNRECTARKSVMDTLNSFYGALMVYTFNIWVSQKKTIRESGFVLKDAERYCSRNVKKVLRDLPKNLLKYDQ